LSEASRAIFTFEFEHSMNTLMIEELGAEEIFFAACVAGEFRFA
jgi:hypothetical protein